MKYPPDEILLKLAKTNAYSLMDWGHSRCNNKDYLQRTESIWPAFNFFMTEVPIISKPVNFICKANQWIN